MALSSLLRLLSASLVFTPLITPAAADANPFFNSELASDSGIEKRQGGTYAVTGATNSQTTQPRLEMRTLQQNADQWNLFLLAMQDFKGADQTLIDSYYTIAQIHGVPNVPWDGVGPNGGGTGYCTHVSPLFPAWHRAYMALFEQAFINHVNIIVSQFQGADQQRYAQAAATLRVPYWDWAAVYPSGDPVMPTSMTDFQITLNTPTGPQTVINPLFRFDFHPLDHVGMEWDPYDNWNVTLRYPTDQTPQSRDDNPEAATVIQNDNPSLRSRVYNLLSQCNDYRGFGNGDPSQRPQQCSEALEDIHNNIHNDVGGFVNGNNGHMAIIPIASYDPAFWLHHMNVDRLFALWQGIYPDSYTVDGHSAQATYAIPDGTQCNGDTFLAPFHSDANGNGLTTNSVRDTNTFKYTYPEFTSGDTSPAGIMAKVNALYGSAAAPASALDKRSASNPYEPKYDAKRAVADSSAALSLGSILRPTSPAIPSLPLATGSSLSLQNTTSLANNAYDLPADLAKLLTPTGRAPIDYHCKVTIQPFNLGGSANVYAFLGNPASEEPTSWRKDKNCVGWVSTFASPGMRSTTLTSGTIPLTAALLKQQAKGVIPGIALNQTLPMLTQQLTWRVQGPQGAIPAEQVPGLTVGVQSAKVKPAASDNEFPTFDTYQTHQSATHGKAGGVQQGMSGDWYNQCSPHA